MQRVIVTVKRKDEARVRDLEVPTNVETERLAQLIANALHWESDQAGQPIQYKIEAQPLKRFLKPSESLESAGVWDGSWLVFHQTSIAGSPPPHHGVTHDLTLSPQGPVVKWDQDRLRDILPRGTDQPLSPDAPSRPDEEERSSGFVWKQVDD